MYAVFVSTTTTQCSSLCFLPPELLLDKIVLLYYVNKYHGIADFQIRSSVNLNGSPRSGLFVQTYVCFDVSSYFDF